MREVPTAAGPPRPPSPTPGEQEEAANREAEEAEAAVEKANAKSRVMVIHSDEGEESISSMSVDSDVYT